MLKKTGLFAILLLIVLWTLVSPRIFAAPDAAPTARSAIEAKVAELVGLVGNGRVDAMVERIAVATEPDHPQLAEARERLINLYGNAGKYSGFDVAGYKSLTPRYQVAYVLIYFEKRPILLEFGFYSVDDKWRPQTLRVETDFKAILDTMPLQK